MSQEVLTVWKSINERLTNFVLGKVKDVDLSKDIVQDVFLKVFSKIDTLRNKEKLVAWIYQITRNEIVSHFRKTELSSSTKEVEEVAVLDEPLTAEFSSCLRPIIDSLPDKYKEALMLADIENVSQKEIAKKLNISYSGVKSRVQRGREMLKSTLLQCCEISADRYGNIIDYEVKDCNRCD